MGALEALEGSGYVIIEIISLNFPGGNENETEIGQD
jgi:hypothetical protein